MHLVSNFQMVLTIEVIFCMTLMMKDVPLRVTVGGGEGLCEK